MRVIDLTMKISPHTLVFPGSPQPSFIAWSTFAAHGYDSEVVHMSTHTGTHMSTHTGTHMSTHTGTHMDVPSHFAKGVRPSTRSRQTGSCPLLS